jgi:cytochrome c oxidase subunit I
MTPAEPLGDIHMPNSSFLPFMMALGLFIAAFGAMYHVNDKAWALPVLIIGLLVTFGSMFLRSVKDDHGFHIHKEDLIDEDDKGVKA